MVGHSPREGGQAKKLILSLSIDFAAFAHRAWPEWDKSEYSDQIVFLDLQSLWLSCKIHNLEFSETCNISNVTVMFWTSLNPYGFFIRFVSWSFLAKVCVARQFKSPMYWPTPVAYPPKLACTRYLSHRHMILLYVAKKGDFTSEASPLCLGRAYKSPRTVGHSGHGKGWLMVGARVQLGNAITN